MRIARGAPVYIGEVRLGVDFRIPDRPDWATLDLYTEQGTISHVAMEGATVRFETEGGPLAVRVLAVDSSEQAILVEPMQPQR